MAALNFLEDYAKTAFSPTASTQSYSPTPTTAQSTPSAVATPWSPTWTNYGSFSLPTIRASDLGRIEMRGGGDQGIQMGDNPTPYQEPYTTYNYQLNGDAYGGLSGDSRNAFNSWSNNYAVEHVDDNNFDVKVKSADKEGTKVRYSLKDGIWTPTQNLGTQGWNTNRMEPKDWLMAAGAIAAPWAIGTALTGGIGSAFGGAAVGGEAGAGAGGLEAALGGLGGVEPIATSGFTAAQGGVGSLGAGWGLPGGVVAGEAGAITGSTAPGLYDTIKQGYDTYNKVKKGYNMVNNLTQPSPTPRTGGAGEPSWLQNVAGGVGGLADLWGAIEGSRQTKDMSGNLKQLYTDALQRRQPFVDKLGQSYTDPNSFYGSNEYKGLADVYQNSIDRQAASKGRMANPTDREVLLQKHAMQEMEKYRQGLRGAAETLSPNYALNPMVAGIGAESRANNPYGALIGDQRTGRYGGASRIVGDLEKIYGGIKNIPDWLKEALGMNESIPGMDFENIFALGGGDEGGSFASLPNYFGGGFGELPGGGSSILDGFNLGDAGGFGFDDIREWF